MKVDIIKILEEAVEDLGLGREFYEQQDQEMGSYFIVALLSDVRSLRLYAGIHSTQFGYLRMLASRFPFAIYYEVEGTTAKIVAILDMRSNPKSIRAASQQRKRQ